MIFNDIDFGDYIKVEKVRDPLLPPILNLRREVPGKNGSLYKRNKLEPKNIEVEIRLIEKNRSKVKEKARTVSRLLYTKEPKKLRFKEEPDKYYLAILDSSTDLERFLFTGFSILTFVALDPIAYGETKTIDITNSPIILNEGTHSTTGTITVEITEATNNLQVTLQNTGEFIYVSHDFVVGDTILIDLEEEMIYKNGYSIMHDCYLESDFFDIPTGEFQISVSSGNATLEFTERWL